jgi:phosphoglycolate phosphatase-like HAD superfamily hydrolase
MNAAFARLHGRTDAMNGIKFAGRTDRAIVTETFEALGIEAGVEAMDALRDAYLEHLREELGKPAPESGVLPGVEASLDAFDARPDVRIGLLTGNFVRGAEIKLGHFGLWHRFAFGAFGDAHADRRHLVPIAMAEARRATGVDIAPSRVVVIGDTPLDVDCAHAHGAVAVAVATGPFSAAELAESRPALVLESLEHLAPLIDLVERLNRS